MAAFDDLQAWISPIVQGAATAKAEVQQDVRDVKTAAVSYAVATLTLQLASTIAVGVVAYVTWQNYKRRQ